MKGDFCIYCLVDPRNGNVFYVGATVARLEVRLSHHCVMSRSILGKIQNEREALIRELKCNGLRPDIIPLKWCTSKTVDKNERAYYSFFKNLGFNMIQDHSKFKYSIQNVAKIKKMGLLRA